MTSDAVTNDGWARVLADGHELPMLGLGVLQVPNGPECVRAVRLALELGYRHIDTAQACGNEARTGGDLDSARPHGGEQQQHQPGQHPEPAGNCHRQ
jgi:hypothetical protein